MVILEAKQATLRALQEALEVQQRIILLHYLNLTPITDEAMEPVNLLTQKVERQAASVREAIESYKRRILFESYLSKN